MKKISVLNCLYFLIIFISISFQYLEMLFNIPQLYFVFLIGITFVVALFCGFSKIMKKKIVIKIFIIGFLCLILSFLTGLLHFIIPFLLAIVFVKKESKILIKHYFIASLVCFSLVLLFSFVGVLESDIYYRLYDGEYVLRNSLGFSGVNAVFIHFFPIVISYIYLYGLNKISFGFILGISLVLYNFTHTRTGLLTLLITISLLNFKKVIKVIEKINFKYLMIVFFIGSVLLALFFGEIGNILNDATSNRFLYWNDYLSGINFGSIMSSNIVDYPVDNLYLIYFFESGIIVGIGIYILYYYLFSKVKLSSSEKLFILPFLIYGMFESTVAFYINPVFMLLVYKFIKGESHEVESFNN